MARIQELSEVFGFQAAIIFLVVFLLGLYCIRLPRNLPPGPSGWPIFGHSFAFRHAPSYVVFTEWSKQYGKVFSVRIGPSLFVILNDFRTVREAMHKQADVFSDRKPSNVSKLFGIKGGIVLTSGAIWKERRRFGLGALRSFGMGKRSVELSINEEARYLLEGFAEQKGNPFDPTHLVINAVSNIICKICFGDRFDYSDEKFARLIVMLREQLSHGPTALINIIALLSHTPLYARLRESTGYLKEFISKIIQEHRESYDENDIRDIIDMHFAEVERRENSGKDDDQFVKDALDDEALTQTIFDLFAAGTDTTSNSLLWLLMFMALNPDIQKKVQSEIEDVIGEDRQPSMADSPNMPYCNAVILEFHRIRPVAPLAVPHLTSEETILDGYKIPKQTDVLINVWALHHDPATWTEPEKYNPARFLSADGKTVVHHESLIPFGTGRRACMGEGLAKFELFILFVSMLQQFTFTFPKGEPIPSLDGVAGIVLSPVAYQICATSRSESN